MTEPTFYTKEKNLIRAIHPAQVSGKKASAVAFERIVRDGKKEKELSVCCPEIEDFASIVKRIHKVILKGAGSEVTTSTLPVGTYTTAANKVVPGLLILDSKTGCHSFEDGTKTLPAYECKLSKSMGPSHSGVMYPRMMNDVIEKAFATILANKSFGKIQKTKVS